MNKTTTQLKIELREAELISEIKAKVKDKKLKEKSNETNN